MVGCLVVVVGCATAVGGGFGSDCGFDRVSMSHLSPSL